MAAATVAVTAAMVVAAAVVVVMVVVVVVEEAHGKVRKAKMAEYSCSTLLHFLMYLLFEESTAN